MKTSLTMLFPDGFAFSETVCGQMDEIGVMLPDDCGTKPISGFTSSADTLIIRGWAIDESAATVAAGVLITLGDRVMEATYGLPRPDIAASRGAEGFLRSGFSAKIAATAGTVGATPLSAYAVSSDATTIMRVAGGQVVQMCRADTEIALSLAPRAGFAAYHIDHLRTIDASGIQASISPLLMARRGVAIELRGWAFDMPAAQSVRGVYLTVDGRDLVRGTIGYPRQDVADANRNNALRDCGFVIRFDTSGLAVGPHQLKLGFISYDGEGRDEAAVPSVLNIL